MICYLERYFADLTFTDFQTFKRTVEKWTSFRIQSVTKIKVFNSKERSSRLLLKKKKIRKI